MHPYCFVITSYGIKKDLTDLQSKATSKKTDPVKEIDFSKIYNDLIVPAIKQADLQPLLESEEKALGNIHKTMYEKIILCEYCVADLTNLNPNVYYELGMRYVVRPFTTIPIIASAHFPLPFDINSNRLIQYQVDKNFNLTNKKKDIKAIADALIYAKTKHSTDSPLYDLVDGIQFQNAVAHEKTDIFRERVKYNQEIKEELASAREVWDDDEDIRNAIRKEAIDAIVKKHEPLVNIEAGVLIDMMISYRDVGAHQVMRDFIENLPPYVFETIMVQEQYAFVLNRIAGKSDPADETLINKALGILEKLEKGKKASSETYGIWGRIFKDKFDKARKAGKLGEAKVHLRKAKEYYQKGFEFDSRDAYPGINYATCLELSGDKEDALRIVPAVEFAVETTIQRKKVPGKDPDYWDEATLLELAVIENKYEKAMECVDECKALDPKDWMKETTTNNLNIISFFRKDRNEDVTKIEEIIKELNN